jgi:hypothetical protein
VAESDLAIVGRSDHTGPLSYVAIKLAPRPSVAAF